ncbi:MAG: tetratricopeptide repeat protein [Candidatus Brocadiae bacterium]|nr:tetratricopeptide repeat protein [Candidatus Brocadiia bacterium]
MRRLYLLLLLACYIAGCGLSQSEIKQREEYLYRAEVYYTNKKYMNSLQQLEYALKLDPECKRAHLSKGWALYYLSKYEGAEESFEKAFSLDDSDPWLHYGLGAVYYKKSLDSIQKISETIKKIEAGTSPQEKESLEKKWTGTLERYAKEKELWLNKSLAHLQKAIDIAPDIIDLHKLIGLNYIARGRTSYLKAIESIDHYLSLLDTEWQSMEEVKKAKELERIKIGIKQTEKERIDIVIENLQKNMRDNRQQYYTSQATAAECFYLLSLWEKEDSLRADIPPEKKHKHQKSMQLYAGKASDRLKSIIQAAPEMANHYRNLAGIAYLQGKPEEASKYLQEYLEQYPLADPQKRAQAKVQLEYWQKEKQE